MTVRARLVSQPTISSTSAEERDLGNPRLEVVTDSLNEGGTYKVTVPGATTDMPISLAAVASAKLIHIITYAKNPNDTPGTLQLKKGTTGGEAWDIVPLAGTLKGVWTITTSGITNLFVTNSGSVVMELTYTVAGD